jgi:hypothetical protein
MSRAPLPPPAHAHHFEALALEDNLLHRLLPVVALALQPVAHFHPADFALAIADHQQNGNRDAIQCSA